MLENKYIIYTTSEGTLHVVVPMPKQNIEQVLGEMTDQEYYNHILEKSLPSDAQSMRIIESADIPATREFRNAWCDVTALSNIDIDCDKAKSIKLTELRAQRKPLLEAEDQKSIRALENNEDIADILMRKQQLRDITEPLKALNTEGIVNDVNLLNTIKSLSVLNYGN